jgi:hypothetical protein
MTCLQVGCARLIAEVAGIVCTFCRQASGVLHDAQRYFMLKHVPA